MTQVPRDQWSVTHVLGMMKRGEEIPVEDIVDATRGSHVARADLERRLTDAGYFYAIAYDRFMPPSWVEQQRADARHYGVGIVRVDADGGVTRVPPEDFFA